MPTGSIEPVAALGAQERRPREGRPYVLSNMVSSADGAIAIDGTSSALGGPADFEMFKALRSVPDVIIVGAGTVREERYKAPSTTPEVQQIRSERGQSSKPAIAIVTASARLDPELPLLADPDFTPLVICGSDADTASLAALRDHAEIIQLKKPRPSPPEVLDALALQGHQVALLEGGPSLNAQFISADCVDEWNLTLSPQLVSGDSGRAALGSEAVNHQFSVRHVWQAEDLLFIQWVRSSKK